MLCHLCVCAGGSLTCTVLLENTGSVTLGSISVPGGCAVEQLAPGARYWCSSSWDVSQEALDAGFITVSVTGVSATPRDGGDLSSPPTAYATIALAGAAGLALSKSYMWAYVSSANQVTTFNITVSNTGAVTLADVAVQATAAQPVMCRQGDGGDYTQLPVASLAPGEMLDCYLKLKPTMEEFENESVLSVNVTATGNAADQQLSSNQAILVLLPLRTATMSLSLLRSTCVVPSAPGGNLTCNVQLAATGNVPLYNVTLESPPGQCSVASLQPGSAHVCTVSTAMSQEVWDGAGFFTWHLVGSAVTRAENSQMWATDAANFTLPVRPELTMTNSVEPSVVEAAGEVPHSGSCEAVRSHELILTCICQHVKTLCSCAMSLCSAAPRCHAGLLQARAACFVDWSQLICC